MKKTECLLLIIASIGIAGAAPVPEKKEIVTVNFLSAQRQPVSPFLAGVNILRTFEDQWVGPSEEKEVATLSPTLQRVPAGMHGMFYDWKTGKYQGRDGRYNRNRKVSELPAEKYFKMAGTYGAEISYVVNINQDPPEKTGQLAKLLKSKGYNVRYWELGNETSAGIFNKKFPDAETYLKIAKLHAKEIKAVFPDAEFGITAKDQKLRFNSWNRVLAKQDFFKNIIIHRYVGVNRKKRKEYKKKGEQMPVAQAYEKMLKHSDPDMSYYRNTFPDKSFWLSEWGLLFLDMDAQNSLAHAIWMARTFIGFLRMPEVKMACYFNLNAAPFELIQPVDGNFLFRVPYYIYEMFLSQVRGAEYSFPASIVKNGRAVKLLDGQFFEDKMGNRAAILVNGSGNEYLFNLPAKYGEIDSVKIIGSDDVSISNGSSFAFTPKLRKQSTEIIKPVMVASANGKFVVPPYAVALIKLKGKETKK